MRTIQDKIDQYHESIQGIDAKLAGIESELKAISEDTTVFDALRSIARAIETIAEGTKLLYVIYNCSHELPGLEIMRFYQGQLEGLDERMKLGISGDIKKRTKSINRSLSFLGFDATFSIIDSIPGRADFVKAIEAAALDELKEYRIKGEWFRPEVAVMDWFFEATISITDDLERAVDAIDVQKQILDALKPSGVPFIDDLEKMVNGGNADPAVKALRSLKRLFGDWEKAFRLACERRDQFAAQKASVEG